MDTGYFPLIDVQATGKNILRLRKERHLTVKDLQRYFGFEEPQAIYKWQWGKCLPSVDNLFALSYLLDVPLSDILVAKDEEPQKSFGSHFLSMQEVSPFISAFQKFLLKRNGRGAKGSGLRFYGWQRTWPVWNESSGDVFVFVCAAS